jgi:hypothetical protein
MPLTQDHHASLLTTGGGEDIAVDHTTTRASNQLFIFTGVSICIRCGNHAWKQFNETDTTCVPSHIPSVPAVVLDQVHVPTASIHDGEPVRSKWCTQEVNHGSFLQAQHRQQQAP